MFDRPSDRKARSVGFIPPAPGAGQSETGRSPRGIVVAGAVAAAVVLLAGANVFAGAGGWQSDKARELETTIAEREKRLAGLDAERKAREEQVAELTRQKNARASELAEESERVASLEKRRETLQRQIADLTAPVSSPGGERVTDAPVPDAVEPPATNTAAQDDPSPPDGEPADVAVAPRGPADAPAPSSAAVDRGSRPSVSASMVAARGDDAGLVEPARAAGPYAVFIHIRSTDPAARSRARAVAAELRRQGLSVAEIRGVPYPVRQDAVRFFYDRDRDAASALQSAVRDASEPGQPLPKAQDFRSYRAAPKEGTLELWLS